MSTNDPSGGNPYGHPQQPGAHPQQGYPQQQQPYPQQQQPYPQQQQPYPQQQQPYPQQQQPYPQQGYPPQQPYPQQQQPYPQQQQPYPQQPHAQQQPQQWGGADPYAPASVEESYDPDCVAAEAPLAARSKFIERTYLHLALAIAVFIVLETVVQMLPIVDTISLYMTQSQLHWGGVLLAFIAVSYIADKWASRSVSLTTQYLGLFLYTLAEVVIFIPLIWFARQEIGGQGILMAGGTTLAMFAAMTTYVFVTRKDFSFLRGMLWNLTAAALCLIVASMVFGFHLGVIFSVGMVVLASGYILFYTSNIIHHYRTTQHVAAALALFSAVALLFWYILRLFMRR